jgi:hypothetical protein
MSLRLPFALPLVLLGACHFDTSTARPSQASDAGQADVLLSAPDANPNAPDADLVTCVGDQLDFTLLNMQACDPPPPSGDMNLNIPGTYSLNTDTGVFRDPIGITTVLDFTVVPQSGAPDLFVTTVTSFEIGGFVTLALNGSRPFVLISTSSIYLFGDISAAANDNLAGVGGDNAAVCATGRGTNGVTQTDDNGNDGGTGGGGGGFGTAGGEGARVDGSDSNNVPGGEASADTTLVPLRGGCSGGSGGRNGGAGGGGGGAMQLVANNGIIIAGDLTASGGGGRGVQGSESGGGGGGSGGGILLQAASLVDTTGTITVNGGGGGEGARANASSDPGDPGSINSDTPAAGGSSGSPGGNGGDGGSPQSPPQNGSAGAEGENDAAGGGGGGGAMGRIRLEIGIP